MSTALDQFSPCAVFIFNLYPECYISHNTVPTMTPCNMRGCIKDTAHVDTSDAIYSV